MARLGEDRFANILAAEVTETAANTLTFLQVATGVSLGFGVGMLIDAVEYTPPFTALAELDADGDGFTCAVTVSDDSTLAIGDPSERRVLTQMQVNRNDAGTAANAFITRWPFRMDYFPPLIVASPRIFCAIVGTSLANPITVRFRIYYRFIQLSDREYLEIAETFQLTS